MRGEVRVSFRRESDAFIENKVVRGRNPRGHEFIAYEVMIFGCSESSGRLYRRVPDSNIYKGVCK